MSDLTPAFCKRDLADSLLEGSDLSARMPPGDMLRMLQEGLAR